MAYFIIAGIQKCKNYNHALYVSNYLEKNLPDFKLHTIEKKSDEWGAFLDSTNKKHGWYHRTSPLIWKELCYRGGNAYLIGGLSEFWEYCYDYYGLASNIRSHDLMKLVEEHVQNAEKQEAIVKASGTLNICISGASNRILRVLLPELCYIDYTPKPQKISIKLFDNYVHIREDAQFLKSIMREFPLLDTSVEKSIEFIEVLQDGIEDCDLLIIADWIKPGTFNDFHDVVIKKMSTMLFYADIINAFGKRNLKVVLAGDGPPCFNATVLIETCTRIRISNIVAITSDIGLSHLADVSQQTGIPLKLMGAPPVWGFIGINQYVDLDSIIHYSEVYIPYTRALQAVKDSTLPPGKTKPELRFLAYLLENNQKKFDNAKKRQIQITKKLGVPPGFAKVRAITSLLKLWYSKEERDDIISLGICSNGAFGLPGGVVFSQPAYLNKYKIWVPFKNFPITAKSKKEIDKLMIAAKEVLDEYGVCGRILNFI